MDSITNSININFKTIEEDDGFAAQVIYEGNIETELVIEGGIDEVKEFATEMPIDFFNLRTLRIVIIGILALFLSGILTPRTGKDEEQIPAKNLLIMLLVIAVIRGAAFYFLMLPTENKNLDVPETVRLN